jgi:hypothetical protein
VAAHVREAAQPKGATGGHRRRCGRGGLPHVLVLLGLRDPHTREGLGARRYGPADVARSRGRVRGAQVERVGGGARRVRLHPELEAEGLSAPEEVGEFDSPRPTRSVKVEVAPEPVAEAPKLIEVEAVAVSADTEAIPSETPNWADELEKRIFEHEKQVNAFLVTKGQIAEGQTFRDISDEGYRNRVLSNTPRFIDAVLKEVA